MSTVTPAGMCGAAYHAAHPIITNLQFGGHIPWEDDTNMARIACPDPDNPVVMEIRRHPDPAKE